MIDSSGYDPDGYQALLIGAGYYDAGMHLVDSSDHAARVAEFQKAERCYLYAAEKGNAHAWLCLGYVYSYDRCEGEYAPLPAGGGRPYPREQRAFECFSRAAQAGLAEGCYKLGDLYKAGVGCAPDEGQAFVKYAEACRLARTDPPVIWGSAALRLATCFENGCGCPQDFSDALRWYRRAQTGLEIAVNDGDWYYERVLARAKKGVQRMHQELHPE